MAALCNGTAQQLACCCCSSFSSIASSATPCVRTNLAFATRDSHQGILSVCHRGIRASRSRKSRVRAEAREIAVTEEELLPAREEDDVELLAQIIVPNAASQSAGEALKEGKYNVDDYLDELVERRPESEYLALKEIVQVVQSRIDSESLLAQEVNEAGLLTQVFVPNLESEIAEETVTEEKYSIYDHLDDLLDMHPEDFGEETLQERKHINDHLDDLFRRRHERDHLGLNQVSRRRVLGAPMFMSFLLAFDTSEPPKAAIVPAKIDSSKVPTSGQFDYSDGRLRDAVSTFRQALDASTVEEEERLWTKIIDSYGQVDAEWVPDILARALGNRGNARSRQGRLEQALGDYNRSIELAPYAVDPVLNRGVALESLGRFSEAVSDYEAVLHVEPEDPAAWNNLGNVKAALRKWDEALVDYSKAVALAPKFSFAAANYALVLYQVGRENEAVRQFRTLLRRYPEFADVRAALAVSLYDQGLYGEAETNWGRLEDGRYANRDWVRNTRRWPPRLMNALENFLDVRRLGKLSDVLEN